MQRISKDKAIKKIKHGHTNMRLLANFFLFCFVKDVLLASCTEMNQFPTHLPKTIGDAATPHKLYNSINVRGKGSTELFL